MAIQTKITKVKYTGQGPIPPISRQLARIIITLSSAEATITASPYRITMTHQWLHHHLIITSPAAHCTYDDVITWHHHMTSSPILAKPSSHDIIIMSSYHHHTIITASSSYPPCLCTVIVRYYRSYLSLYYRSCIVVVLQPYGTPNRVTAHRIDPDRTRRSRFESRWPQSLLFSQYYKKIFVICCSRL